MLIMTLALVLASFVVMWVKPEFFLTAMPFLAAYFGVITGIQHYVVAKSMYKSARRFVQVFLGTTVAVLFIHLVVLVAYILTHLEQAKTFMIAFCIGYVVSLVFETVAMVQLVNKEKKSRS